MNKDIVKYDNDMNTVTFGKFKEKELDLFFSICFKVRDMGVKKVILSFSELKELSNYSNRNVSRFIKDLSSTYDKMLGLNIKIMHSELSFTKFNLFSEYTVNAEEKTIIIQVHEKFEYILNKMLKEGNYTKFELIEFVNLRSSYSKNMFRLLKQWESKKIKKFTIEEFRELLVVPPKYRMSEIDKFILSPIIQELSNFFPNLNLEKIKTGKKITHLKFTWTNKKQEIKEVEKIEIEISEKLNRFIQKAKKNRFIEKLFTNENIEILVNTFNEIDLIKGLDWSYKEIKQEINSLNYLIKSIKTGIEKTEKKIVVKEDIKEVQEPIIEKNSQVILENPKIEIPEKIIVTQDEYEEIYKNHLKENNMTHNKFTRLAFDKSTESKYTIENFVDKRIEITQSEFNEIENAIIFFLKLSEKEYSKNIFDKNYKIVEKIELEENLINLINQWNLSSKDILQGISMGYTREESIKTLVSNIKETYNVINFYEIPEEKLLGKTGKKLVGGALQARLKKIAKELNKSISYKDKIID